MSDSLLRTIFAEALDRPTAAERARFLDEACGPDVALRRQVEELLRANDEAGSFFADTSKKVLPPETAISQRMEKPGDRIGRYKLLQEIGEGGCGLVYMAEQEEPVRRRVALKVIKLGMDTREVIARFEAERQALALMDHPNIAKVLDAGATDAGRPYFVMELVRGVKITEFCDENKLSTEDRLKLFIEVCQAIQHAHQKGIIHRDIKPSNILVTVNDGEPVPKVIDFGIAKATQGRLTDKTLFTAFQQFIGTPAYMSPEQAVMTSLDIDTRSDIYSLGVLLYELLTGRPPFDQQELLASGLDEMRRTICEKEPPKPSTRLSSLNQQELTTTAQRRRTEAPKLVHLVRGDLDWLVMRCLEKNRARRYETANGLANDVGRYLKNEPIVARPPSQWYLLQKLARRHRATLFAATLVVLALLLAVVALTISNVRIRDEQSQKEEALVTARRSEQGAKAQLFSSLVSQAEARRYSHRMGQRLESLAALNQAASIKRNDDLRDATIATLALPDLRPGPTWRAYDTNDHDITFDPNYQRYACIDTQATIRVCTVADQREVQRFASGPRPQSHDKDRAFHFSPDGRLLAKFEVGDRWSVWRVEDAQLVLRSAPASSVAAAFSSDSRQLAIPIGNSIVVLDLNTGQELKRWPFQHLPRTLAFSPDNRRLASGPARSEVISVFDVHNGRLLSELRTGSGAERTVQWHPSGKHVALCVDHQIEFWDVDAAARVSVLEGHAQAVTTLSFDPSGNWLISDSWDGLPRLWQPSPAREAMRIFSGENSLKFSQDGRWAGVLYLGKGQVRLLEFIPSLVYHTFVGSLSDAQHSFHAASISPDGRLLALASAGGVEIRELPSGRVLARLPAGHDVLFHPNGAELLISGPQQCVEAWPMSREMTASNTIRYGRPRRLPVPFVPYRFVLARDGRTLAVAAGHAGEARLLDLDTGVLHDLKFPHPIVDGVALSPDAQWVATTGWHSKLAQLWNARTGQLLLTVDLTGERAFVACAPDNRQLVVAMSREYVFYDLSTQRIIRRFERQDSMHPGCTAFSHDGKLVAMEMSPGVIRLCELSSGRTIAHLQDPNRDVGVWMGFTPDDSQLIVASSYAKAIHRWDLRALRVELKAMGLDWDWPEFPPPSEATKNPPAMKVEVATGPLP